MTDNRPISEIYREAGEEWVVAKARADILEDTKSAHLSQMILRLQANNSNLALNRAEAEAKASVEWTEYVHEAIEARKEANLLWVRMESVKMAYGEWQSAAANERLVAKL